MKADLTSADLTEIRQSALGAADPLGVAAELADAVDAGKLADTEDAGYAFALAAEIAESRGKLDAAQRYADRAVEAFGERDDNQAAGARALRARVLFRLDREDEAMAVLEPLRPLLTTYPDAASYVSAALAAGGRNRVAEQWLSEAVNEALAERGATAEPASAEDAGQLFFLLQQRHRVRHALGLQHDHHDNLADRLETRLANEAARAAGRPGEDLLFWPEAELGKLLAQWPGLAETYGADWDEHRAHLERELVRLAAAGRAGLTVLPATVAGLTGFAGADGDPASPQSRSGYAGRLATGADQIPWPPERNGACWCGSGLKYKKCCLPRSRA
ncbi:preprotein translocase SecA [Paractinoplanes deccanensis]|uniref:Preprotein translocase SecA n=1 Tax=Paractinoplanes deccanensis TaxID=113561 RepID=A0ABQ3YEI3_9ACTN|nr:SEC-C domain-containing protein [Actinoplanes deccanensis]GID78401.1 preprotein translocase SecA [Actinoplanes deccanensis]